MYMNNRKFFTFAFVLSMCALPLTSSAIMAQEPVACTMDARMCPDGTYVGRVAPNCEFSACPTESAPAPVQLNQELKRGESNEAVRDLQTILRSEPSIYTGPATGYFGPMTEAAIKKLQEKYNLPVTGLIDAATQEILYPTNVNAQITVRSPNGGEVWKAGETATIAWNVLWSRNVEIPSTSVSQLPIPEPRATPSINNSDSAGGTAISGSGASAMGGTSVSQPAQEVLPIRLFFPRASVTLLRDSDPAFARLLGTVNLRESQRTIKIPTNVPLANDYRIRIGMDRQTPCLYRAENDSTQMGKMADSNMPYPCPMEKLTPSTGNLGGTDNSAMPNYIIRNSDVSDGTFSIVAGTISTNNNEEITQKIAEIQAMIIKLMDELKRIKEMTNTTAQ